MSRRDRREREVLDLGRADLHHHASRLRCRSNTSHGEVIRPRDESRQDEQAVGMGPARARHSLGVYIRRAWHRTALPPRDYFPRRRIGVLARRCAWRPRRASRVGVRRRGRSARSDRARVRASESRCSRSRSGDSLGGWDGSGAIARIPLSFPTCTGIIGGDEQGARGD
jgi:hypothetical protein